jgi:phosphoglycerol transferase MdoB-like AlkP superfamily enzyme
MEDAKLFEFVPLYILTPGNKIYREQKTAASFLDIAPTVMAASKIKFSIKSNGNDLLAAAQEQTKIKYKGSAYSREDLFSRIRQAP